MKENYNTIVIGGGASGMIAAVTAAEHGESVLLLEKADRLGRKISASGNGRCNMMNTGVTRYFGATEFANEVIRNCSIDDMTAFFRRYGLIVTEEQEGRVYPVTMQSVSVLNALQHAMKMNHVDILLRTVVTRIRKEGSGFICKTEDEKKYKAQRMIICAGGAAQKRLGGSTDGYRYLQAMGHRLEPLSPSLVPVITDSKSISGLSGIRVRCRVSLIDKKEILHQEEGEVLFTDYGLSGICVMQCSRFIDRKGLHMELDLLSSVFSSPDKAYEEMLTRRETFAQYSPVLLLEGILVPKLAYAVLKQAGIPLRGETTGSISDNNLQSIVKTAYHYRADVIGTRTLDDAQVTAGGISCDDFFPQTMESRITKGLFAAGEVLNVDGDCGGFNLMFAFASGMIAGGFRKNEPYLPEEQ